jgi:CYTH domain-containing protein
MIEHERTFLIKILPTGLEKCKSKEIIDVYHPKEAVHPVIRLRKNGDKYELTKKELVDKGDHSRQKEQTINLTQKEFEAFSKLPGKKIHKIRYMYSHDGRISEIDVFKGELEGLAFADFEFKTEEEKEAFKMPDFCLVEVTNEEFMAGGMLCGKKYEEIESKLAAFGYKKPL